MLSLRIFKIKLIIVFIMSDKARAKVAGRQKVTTPSERGEVTQLTRGVVKSEGGK